MTPQQLLTRQLNNQLEAFIKMARRVPSDRLDWVPQEGMRSARDQFQEVATIVSEFWSIYAERSMDYDEGKFFAWKESRAAIHDLDALEARLREDTARLVAFVEQLEPSELDKPVQMPWPGDHIVLDNITFHLWNMAYHEGQISYILQLIGENPMG